MQGWLQPQDCVSGKIATVARAVMVASGSSSLSGDETVGGCCRDSNSSELIEDRQAIIAQTLSPRRELESQWLCSDGATCGC